MLIRIGSYRGTSERSSISDDQHMSARRSLTFLVRLAITDSVTKRRALSVRGQALAFYEENRT